MTFDLILVDAELERIPGGSYSILDSHLHGEIMRDLPDSSRRGRPDIVHSYLSLCQSSIPNKRGMISTFVHTRDDVVISVDRNARIPAHYLCFLEDMSELFRKGESRGMRLEKGSLEKLLLKRQPDHVICLSPHGQKRPLSEVLKKRNEERVAILVGGFPEGDYASPVYELSDLSVSLAGELLTVWAVTCEVLCAFPR